MPYFGSYNSYSINRFIEEELRAIFIIECQNLFYLSGKNTKDLLVTDAMVCLCFTGN